MEFNYKNIIKEKNKRIRRILDICDRKDNEIKRLNKGYCELKEKCNKGECDCTQEEYDSMCEENLKLSLKIDELIAESTKWESKFYDEAKKVDKAINILELSAMNKGICTQIETDTIQHTLLILKGVDKE